MTNTFELIMLHATDSHTYVYNMFGFLCRSHKRVNFLLTMWLNTLKAQTVSHYRL